MPLTPEREALASMLGALLLVCGLLLAIILVATSCAMQEPAPPTTQDSGFSRFCAAHPHHGTCP